MSESKGSEDRQDPHSLKRFLDAQSGCYAVALSEIRAGQKLSHWMWYIFPQIDGLAFSETSKFYSIKSAREARHYLEHEILGPRLAECVEAVMGVEGRSVQEIFGFPDYLKLSSCATLFECVLPSASVFAQLLDKCYQGRRDEKTLTLLRSSSEADVS